MGVHSHLPADIQHIYRNWVDANNYFIAELRCKQQIVEAIIGEGVALEKEETHTYVL